MYIPPIYQNENWSEIEAFIKEYSFAVLVSVTQGKLWASHIPLLLAEKSNGQKLLIGHLSKANLQAQHLSENEEILAIFSGPHAYISSSWYDHENVPTWNYIAVHVYGTVRLHSFEETLAGLKQLVDSYEARSEHPIRVEELSEKTMREAHGIISFEIAISRIEAQYKLSQNRDEKNHQNITTALEKRGDVLDREVASLMRKNRH